MSAPALGLTPDTAQARTPSTPGPVLRYGNHRAGDPTFLEIQCNPKETPNDGARISGFRLFGPEFGQQKTFEIGIRVRRCIDIEIANMEIAGWGASAIRIDDVEGADQSSTGDGPYGRIMNPDQIRIHHNFIHHNQHPSARPDTVRNTIINVVTLWIGGKAEGYGVNVHNGAWAKISENVFDFNRHAIAASGKVGGYNAERNLTLKGGGYHGKWYGRYTHIFDVHGTGCWWSSNLCGEAGDRIWYETNAFQYRNGPAIKLRGRPRRSYPVGGAYIADNIFPHDGLENDWGDDAVHLQTSENVKFGPNNVIKVDTIGQYGVCDFDGDAIDDLFLATGRTWWFSSFGEYQWSYLNAKNERLSQVRLGYFDDDDRCDVLAESGDEWVISSGGTGEWRSLGAFGSPLSEVRFGRFDPRHRDSRPGRTRRTTHAFKRRADGQWFVTSLAMRDWQPGQSSSVPFDQLQFGDFNGDGVTDVLAVIGGRWAVSDSAASSWRPLNSTLGDPVGPLFIANMDPDDNIDDILRLEQRNTTVNLQGQQLQRTQLTWYRSKNGTDAWREYKTFTFDFRPSKETISPGYGFVGRFGAAPGGGVMVVDQNRFGQFYAHAEAQVGASPTWTSVFAY